MDFSTRKIGNGLRTLVSRHRRGDLAPANAVLIGLLGRGTQSSRTPAMHEREGARLGIQYTYVLIDFDVLGLADEALTDVVEEAKSVGFAGLNVTHPFKQRIVPHLTTLEPVAEAIGAVNTVVFGEGGTTAGYNTDAWGFAASFAKGMADCSVDRVLQFGAGGAGAAVAHALLDLGANDLAIVDSDGGKARLLAENLSHRFGRCVLSAAAEPGLVGTVNGVVNTTPVGMAKYPGTPFPVSWLSPRQWVAEIIYFPEETELLRKARIIGCRTLPGTGMAIYQAVRAFELFTGIAPDPAAMVSHFEAAA